MFSAVRYCWTVFQSGCTILHSHKQLMQVPRAPHLSHSVEDNPPNPDFCSCSEDSTITSAALRSNVCLLRSGGLLVAAPRGDRVWATVELNPRCVLSLRGYSLVLPVVQCLKWVTSFFIFGVVPVLLLCTTGGLIFTSSFNKSGSRSPLRCVFFWGGLCIKVSKIYPFLSLPCDNDGWEAHLYQLKNVQKEGIKRVPVYQFAVKNKVTKLKSLCVFCAVPFIKRALSGIISTSSFVEDLAWGLSIE